MDGNVTPSMLVLEVGKRYPGLQTNQYVTKIEYNGVWRLIAAMPRLTDEEIADFKSGKLEIGMADINGKIFILHKFGGQPWSDAPYEPRLYPEPLEYPPMQDDSLGIILQVELYDSATGILKVLRVIGLPNELSNQLHSRCTDLAALGQINQATNNWQVEQVYKKYRTSTSMLRHVKKVYEVCNTVWEGAKEQTGGPQIDKNEETNIEADDSDVGASANQSIKEPCFNHFVINNGLNLVQSALYLPDNPEMYHARLRKLKQDSLTAMGAKVIGNIIFRAVVEGDAYTGAVFSCINGKEIPLLATFGAKTEKAGEKIWKEFQDTCNAPDIVWKMPRRPSAPFVADYIFGSGLADVQASVFFMSGMSADFCKFMGWAFLFPEVIAL